MIINHKTLKRAGCFVVMSSNDDGFVFVRDKGRQQKLGFVGGGRSVGESTSAAAIREAQEELGLQIRNRDLLRVSVRVPIEGSSIAPTVLYHAGGSWKSKNGTKLILPEDLQSEEVSEVVYITRAELQRCPSKWSSEFYTGHCKILGAYMRWLQIGTGQTLYIPSEENPW